MTIFQEETERRKASSGIQTRASYVVTFFQEETERRKASSGIQPGPARSIVRSSTT